MDLLEVERQRLLLEENLAKLKASLKHYQTLTVEYEALSEEIQTSAGDLNLQSISESYAGDIVDQKEIQSLAGLPASPRSGAQVLDLINKRQEYVQLNIETLQRQFWDAEAKLEELDFAAYSTTRDHEQNALPLTEIHEELDEDGNVVTSRLVQPEAATERLVDTLRKAGLSDADLEDDDGPGEKDTAKSATTTGLPSALVTRNTLGDVNPRQPIDIENEALSERPSMRKKSVSFSADTKPPPSTVRQESEDGKRTVSFNDKVAVMPSAPLPDTRSVSFAPKVVEIPPEDAPVAASTSGATASNSDQPDADMQKRLREFMFKPGDRVGDLNSEDELTNTHVVLPENESAEDAALRREMLEYHLNEVGHVVAQMDLDEDDYDLDDNASTSDFPSPEYQEEDTPYTSGLSDSDRESEDEYGRSTRKVISDDYHKEMQELQQRLIGNLGPAPTAAEVSEVDADIDAQHVHRLVVQDSTSTADSNATKTNTNREGRKRVSFADTPSFAQEQDVARKAANMLRDENEVPLADMVSERTQTTKSAIPITDTNKASSELARSGIERPKSTASSSSSPPEDAAPEGPPGQTIAETLIERPTRAAGVVAPSADEQDPVMQRRELAEEYYRRRNNMIRQQGGFKADPSEDDEQGEMMEERDGKVKKVSRFRAARIK
ncbi:putative prefoldin [Septoria linicola]|nr:putative prefoldin [Septoria linicola]